MCERLEVFIQCFFFWLQAIPANSLLAGQDLVAFLLLALMTTGSIFIRMILAQM